MIISGSMIRKYDKLMAGIPFFKEGTSNGLLKSGTAPLRKQSTSCCGENRISPDLPLKPSLPIMELKTLFRSFISMPNIAFLDVRRENYAQK